MFCTDWTLRQERAEGTYYEPLPCRCWTCERCQPRRRRELITHACDGEPKLLITLTSNPDRGKTPDWRARCLVAAWRKVRTRAIKKYGYSRIPFFAVFEATKRGEPHLHILVRARWIDQAWLSKQMTTLNGAPICDVRRIQDSGRAAAYVSKYIGKEPHHFAGTKRYWRSLDYLPRSQEKSEDTKVPSERWQVEHRSFDIVKSMARLQGYAVVAKPPGVLVIPPNYDAEQKERQKAWLVAIRSGA